MRDPVFEADERRFNRDPVDSLIVDAAIDLGVPLIRRDRGYRQVRAVGVIW